MLCYTGYQQHCAENGKQNNFVRLVAGKLTQAASVSYRNNQGKNHGCQRDRD